MDPKNIFGVMDDNETILTWYKSKHEAQKEASRQCAADGNEYLVVRIVGTYSPQEPEWIPAPEDTDP